MYSALTAQKERLFLHCHLYSVRKEAFFLLMTTLLDFSVHCGHKMQQTTVQNCKSSSATGILIHECMEV